jgi:hypothetical protein
MSTALAIASVTAVLKDLLNNGLIDHDVSASVGNVIVTALPLDRIDTTSTNQTSQLNLFLYQATPNAAWRNAAMPSRNSQGERISNQPLALDLHYMLTAFGAEELHAEILLGYGMQLLHETPILARTAVRRGLAPPSNVPNGSGLPAAMRALFTSELAEQVELIKIVPQALSNEEISRLWAAFQAPYRPSAAYQASAVLIENRASTRSALPVAARRLYVVPFKPPVIDQVRSQTGPAAPIRADQPILTGHNLVLIGHDLGGEDTLVVVGDIAIIPPADQLGDEQVIVPVPGGLAAGVLGVQVIHRRLMGEPATPHRGAESNLAAFVLSPRVTNATVSDLTTGSDGLVSALVTITLAPAVQRQQRVMLFLNELDGASPPAPGATLHAYSFSLEAAAPSSPPASPPSASDTVAFAVQGVAPGTYLVRVRVDGADSPLVQDASGRYHLPRVVLT